MIGIGRRPASRRWSGSGNKKTRRVGAGRGKGGRQLRSDRLSDSGVDGDGVRMMALGAFQLVTAGEHPVELVDEQRDGLVAFVGFDGGVHIGSVDGDMALGFEARADGLLRVALQFNAYAYDAFLVAKQSLGFFADKGFERRSQLEMNAGDDELVGIWAVHNP